MLSRQPITSAMVQVPERISSSALPVHTSWAYVTKGYASEIVLNKDESTLKMYVKAEHIRDVFKAGTKQKAHFVTCDTYVTMSDGTGIVHIAPAFGEDDSRIGRNYDLPFVQFVDGRGNLTKETPYAGIFVKKADPMVLTDLDKESKLFDAPKFEHEYPHCWRCDTPLIYYARAVSYTHLNGTRT